MASNRVRKVIGALGLGGGIAIVGYSTVRTYTADPACAIIVGAMAIAVLGVLTAVRWIATDQAEKGLLHSIYSLLPGVFEWSTGSTARLIVVLAILVTSSLVSLWLGPQSLHRINVRSDSAAYIRLDSLGGEFLPPADGWLSVEVWRPGKNRDEVMGGVLCLNDRLQSWSPTRRGDILECGEPLNPLLIECGIDVSEIDLGTVMGRRTSEGVKALREALDASLPQRDVKDALLLATWDIRSFGRKERLPESIHYIAEIISHFDIVALQEVHADISDLNKVIDLLGKQWSCVYSLVSPGPRGDNERMAFVFDKRKVRVGPMVSNLVLQDTLQPARPPYAVTFDVLNRRLTLVNVHIIWGRKRKDRVAEAEAISETLYQMWQNEPAWSGDLVLLGTINSPRHDSPEVLAFSDRGFTVDSELTSLATNVAAERTYDQIFSLQREGSTLRYGQVGVFDFHTFVFKTDDEALYRAEMAGTSRNFRVWRSYQMSSHLPKWVELRFFDSNSGL